ncbi:hypothetical protein KZ779_06265 [Escherichia coli]|nr:hypothetical protein [Escherichia coli]
MKRTSRAQPLGKELSIRGEEIGTVLEGEIVLTINGQDYHLVAGAKLCH